MRDEPPYPDIAKMKVDFTTGDATQTTKAFERQIKSRFGGDRVLTRAWNGVEETIDSEDQRSLEYGRRSFERSHQPMGDLLRESWREDGAGFGDSRTGRPPQQREPSRHEL